jgi:RHS repeat-associated protein
MRGSVIDEVVNGYQNNSGAMTNYTYHHDSLESVLGQSGNTGTVVAAQGYTSFGSIVPSSTITGTTNNTLKYTGREMDTETGLIYARARYYDLLTGRYISEDPIRSGLNYYTYCGNYPINCRDPYGLVNWPNWLFGVGDMALGWLAVGYGAEKMLTADIYGLPASVPVFMQGMGSVSAGLITVANAKIDIANAWNETDEPGALETVGNAIGGQSGGVVGASVDLYFQVFQALGAAGSLYSLKDFYDLSSGINTLNNKFGKPNTSNSNSNGSSNNSTKQQSVSNANKSNNSISNAANQAANAALSAATNSAMDNINSIINTPIPAPPPVSMPNSGTSYPLPPPPNFNDEEISAADGGFILYPNMSNTNQIQSVYSKK